MMQALPPPPPMPMPMAPATGGCFGGCVNSCEAACPAQCCPSYVDPGQVCNAQCPSSCAPSCTPDCCGAVMPALPPPPPPPQEGKEKKRPPQIIPVVGPSPFDTCPGACPMSCAPGCDFDCCRPFLDPTIVQEMRSETQPNTPAAVGTTPGVEGDQASPMTRVIHVSHVLRPEQPAARSSPINCPMECKQHCSPSCAKDGCCTDKKRRRKRKRSHIPHSPRMARVYEDIYDREFNEQPVQPFYYEFDPDF